MTQIGSDRSDLLVVDRVERELRGALRDLSGPSGGKLPEERELARRYGVSRESVRQAMARLKRENLVRSIRGKGTFAISPRRTATVVHLVTSGPLEQYNMMAAGVLSEVLKRRGLTSHLACSRDPAAEWDAIINGFRDGLGMILVGAFERTTVEALISRCELPVVHVSDLREPFRSSPVCDAVVNDNVALACGATEYLIRQGHRRIALLGWDSDCCWDREMIRGYSDTLRAHGIDPRPEWRLEMPSSRRNEDDPQRRLAQAERVHRTVAGWPVGQEPTALVHFGADEIGMRDAIDEYLGSRFAGQVMAMTYWELLLMGYRGTSDATAAAVRFEDIAERAVEVLLNRQEDTGPPVREIRGRAFLCERRGGVWRPQR